MISRSCRSPYSVQGCRFLMSWSLPGRIPEVYLIRVYICRSSGYGQFCDKNKRLFVLSNSLFMPRISDFPIGADVSFKSSPRLPRYIFGGISELFPTGSFFQLFATLLWLLSSFRVLLRLFPCRSYLPALQLYANIGFLSCQQKIIEYQQLRQAASLRLSALPDTELQVFPDSV